MSEFEEESRVMFDERSRLEEEKKKAQEEALAIMQQATPGPEQFAPKPDSGPDQDPAAGQAPGEPKPGGE